MTRIDAKDSALVLFSGGQDSATCLAWALERYKTAETLGFDYGQRHRVELECRDGARQARRTPVLRAKIPAELRTCLVLGLASPFLFDAPNRSCDAPEPSPAPDHLSRIPLSAA